MFDPRKLMDMMKQANDMQQKFQEELKTKVVTGSAGGGMVQVTMNGQFEVLDMVIEDALFAAQDPGFAKDILKAAVNDACQKVRDMMAQESKSLLGKLGL